MLRTKKTRDVTKYCLLPPLDAEIYAGLKANIAVNGVLILDVRLTAEIAERSIAGQIEFWAQLGRAIEPLLEGSRALALRRAGAAVPPV